ncbi:hypothetical protein [Actinoplanes sp. NPDC089786]|uniref:hypothetical protein n=1 Tax=Actinoplanes sp. NPDC089786 TaxID=3155185 RepID=UPI00341D7A7F
MSYAATYPPQAPPPAADPPRRPVATQLAAVLLLVMAFVGLAYAVVTLIVTPGVIDRFRADAGSAASADVDGYVTVVWTFAALGTVLAVVLFALYIVLALGLRRGSNGSRIATWVVCALGVLVGCGSAIAVGAQRAGDGTPGTLGSALTEAYPGSWIGLNVTLLVAQIVGYLIVALLLVVSRGYFRPAGDPAQRSQSYVALPTYGSANAYPGQPQPMAGQPQPVSGAPGHHPTAAFPASPTFPATTAHPAGSAHPAAAFPAAPPVVQPPYGPPQPAVVPPGAVPTAEDHAFWSRPAAAAPASAQPTPGAAPSAPHPAQPTPADAPADAGAAPGGRLASEEAARSDQAAPIPPAAASPTPVAPPYDEPDRPSGSSGAGNDVKE